jgi:hypothetical protein
MWGGVLPESELVAPVPVPVVVPVVPVALGFVEDPGELVPVLLVPAPGVLADAPVPVLFG